MDEKTELTQENRLLAALAHASVIASGMGIVVGLVIYITQKEKSLWTAGQGLEAAIYQTAGLAITVFAWVVWTIFYLFITFALVAGADSGSEPPAAFWFSLATMCCPSFITAAWILYGFYGAIRAWAGANFHYIGIGRLVDGYLEPAAVPSE